MRQVSAAVEVLGPHRRQWLFDRLRELDVYNRQLEGLLAVEFLQRTGSRYLSRWALEVQGCPVGWIQEDHFDLDRFAYHFRGREGDFTHISGSWRVEPLSHGSAGSMLRFDAEWDLGVPIVDDLLGNAIEVQMRRAVRHVLTAMKGDMEGNRPIEDRLRPRANIHSAVGLSYPGGQSLAQMRDISAGGARIDLGEPRLIQGEGLLIIPRDPRLPRVLPGQVVWADESGEVGLRFEHPLVNFAHLTDKS